MKKSNLFLETKSGFTLMEVMLSVTIMFTAMMLVMNFVIETGRINFVSAEKNDINRELRNVVDRMASEAKQSNLFIIYRSANPDDRVDQTDRVRPNESGDCVLLVFKSGYAEMIDQGGDPLHDPRPITRMVMYYRSVTTTENGNERGPVRRWELDRSSNPITDAASIHNLETLIPDLATLDAQSTQVVELSEGLADGRLFFNYQNRTAMINGKIIHGNQAKWITDTYNFSISPRG